MNARLLLYIFRLLFALIALSPLPALAVIDDDQDGMSDLWENLHGFSTSDDGTLTPAQAPTADPDGDGMSNLSESIAATNPLGGIGNSGIFRASLAPSVTLPGNLELTWPQLRGKVYQPQISSNLSPASWAALGESTVATVAGVNRLTVPQNGARSFLRVAVDDIDQDGDTLTSWEEGLLNTNPKLPPRPEIFFSHVSQFRQHSLSLTRTIRISKK